MLLPQALVAASLALHLIQSSLSSSSAKITPSPTITSNASHSTVGTTFLTVVDSTTTKQVIAGGSSFLSGAGDGITTVSVTESAAYPFNQTASVFAAYVSWSSWSVEDTGDCQKKCCDTGGPAIRQIRNCTIIMERCKGLNRCSHYGPVERDVSCYIVCDCMRSLGHSLDAPEIIMIMSNILAVICVMITSR
ncbi:uncharacterized protein LOC111320554 [Stylophora pistillata]|nr:uncharacterized protein LOC111320554 [Stylophora pistillata]